MSSRASSVPDGRGCRLSIAGRVLPFSAAPSVTLSMMPPLVLPARCPAGPLMLAQGDVRLLVSASHREGTFGTPPGAERVHEVALRSSGNRREPGDPGRTVHRDFFRTILFCEWVA
jgi:hypothetical protein